ncbi:MAG: ATP-dependent DNA helicase RecQ [Cyanobacteria bacterium RM1_2_2]|nr:ATP-dependent DNA helicase RecQ [Cyanobacteria bacterium RM1_2_2]
MLEQAISQRKTQLRIADFCPTTAILALALLDSFALIEHVSELYNLPLKLPSVEIYLVGDIDNCLVNNLLHNYRGAKLEEAAQHIDSCQTSVEILQINELLVDVDFLSAAETSSSSFPEHAYTFNELEDLVNTFIQEVEDAVSLEAQPVNFDRPVLDYFARRYFLVPELKLEQLQLIQRALRNKSGLGLLPTGFGKSLVYQLYALLIPRTTLVISPLRALIRDQMHNLHRAGLTCVNFIDAADTQVQRETTLHNFQSRRYRLLYISPERLQIKGFFDELKSTMQQTPVGALVIDEAHCVSEWGHDFRPAYLQVGILRKALEEACGRSIPIIALTATASEAVRRDILRVLNLTSNDLVQGSSSDRPNLSLSVHAVEKPEEKPQRLVHLLQNVVSKTLNIPFSELISQISQVPHAGVIFGIYANPHGKSNIHEGVHFIADKLLDQLISEEELIQVHANTAPESCPKCGSYFFIRSNEQANCLSCSTSFQARKSVRHTNWDRQIRQVQDAFQNNEFPLLVATKGYGMGIDKRNIRYVIHYAFSSSLESYYQEAGRSGRDGQHAHVALLYLPPHSKCREEYLDAGRIEPPCVSNGQNYIRHHCPYYKTHLCDYGLQSHFIKDNYKGISRDIQNTLNVYQELASGKVLEFASDKDDKQIELYRLQQLGIVKEYTKNYSGQLRGSYEVEYDSKWRSETISSNLKRFLIETGISETYADKQLEPFYKLTVNQFNFNEDVREKALNQALKILLERVYETVPRMRYQMLLNELDYATAHESETCRRVVIRGLFDSIEHLTTEKYRCGFCDVCVPSLEFKVGKAAIPLQDAQVDEIADQLITLLEGFRREVLLAVVRLAIERGAVAGLFSHVVNRLERDPTNLAALYLAGALARNWRGRETRAFSYLEFGFTEGLKQGLGCDDLLMFYQEAVLLRFEEAFQWLTTIDGLWDNKEGLEFLIQEAKQRFGSNSKHYRILLLRWKLRYLEKVADDFTAMRQHIKTLKSEL